MCREISLDTFCELVCRQVPEADPAEVRRYVRAYIYRPYEPADVYQCARIIEQKLICEGSI